MMLMITKVLKEENLKHLQNKKIKVLFLQNIHHLKNLMTVMKIIVMMPVQLVEEEENLKHIQNMKKKIKILLLQRLSLQNVHHLRNIMTVMKIIVMMPVQLVEEEEVVEDEVVEDEAEPREEEKDKNGLKLKRRKKKDYSWLANIMTYSVKRERKKMTKTRKIWKEKMSNTWTNK